MSDKFEKLSIYNVDFKLTDDDGVEHVFTFKPLPFSRFADAFDFFMKFESYNKDSEGLSDEEKGKKFIELLDKESIKILSSLLYDMVTVSYPELSKDKVENFVLSNMFSLIEPLSNVTFRQAKSNPRKAQAVLNKG